DNPVGMDGPRLKYVQRIAYDRVWVPKATVERREGGPPRQASTTPARSAARAPERDRKSTRLNSSHVKISYAVFCLKKKKVHRDFNLLEYYESSQWQFSSRQQSPLPPRCS